MDRGEEMEKITAERLKHFYWKRIICQYDLPNAIFSENETQFTSTVVTDLCMNLGMHAKFVFVVHPQSNGKFKLGNNVILKGL